MKALYEDSVGNATVSFKCDDTNPEIIIHRAAEAHNLPFSSDYWYCFNSDGSIEYVMQDGYLVVYLTDDTNLIIWNDDQEDFYDYEKRTGIRD